MQEALVRCLGREDPLEEEQAAHSSILGLPWWLSWYRIPCNARDLGEPWVGRSPGEGTGCPLQYSWASLVAQLVQNPLQFVRPGCEPWVGRSPGGGTGCPPQYSWASLAAPTRAVRVYVPAPTGTAILQHPSP